MKTTSSDVTCNSKIAAQPTPFSLLLSRLDQGDQPFLQPSTAPQLNVESVLGAHQRPTEIQNLEISQQEQNLAGTDNHVHNPFTQAHDTLGFYSATDNTKYGTINPNNQPSLPPHSLHTAPITLDNSEANENDLLNLLPPITNLSLSIDSNTAKSEYCDQNFTISIAEHLFSNPVTENRFTFQTPNQACHDNQKEQIARYNKGKSNPVIQQQSLQAFAQEIDCSPSKSSTQELRTPLNFQQMRIVARSQQKISQVLLRKTFNYKIRSTHMQQMLSK